MCTIFKSHCFFDELSALLFFLKKKYLMYLLYQNNIFLLLSFFFTKLSYTKVRDQIDHYLFKGFKFLTTLINILLVIEILSLVIIIRKNNFFYSLNNQCINKF